MGRGVGTAVLCAAALAAGSAAAQPAPQDVVGCDRAAAGARVSGTRVLLDAIVLSSASELEQPALGGREPWRWQRPLRIAVRDGEPDVEVAVPVGWRHRLAVSWAGGAAASSARFARCAAAPGRGWSVWEGRLHLRRRGDCVPLTVRVGGTSTQVRLGVGRACGATRRA